MKKLLGRLVKLILPAPLRESPDRAEVEDIGVEGKRFPTNVFGRTIARHPIWMFLTILLPIAFFVIGCMKIRSDISYELSDFQLRSSVAAQQSAATFASVMDGWTSTISGADRLNTYLDTAGTRTNPRDTLELRLRLDVSELTQYCVDTGKDIDTECPQYRNFFQRENMAYLYALEAFLRELASFQDVCFTNDLEYGRLNVLGPKPNCVPPTSVTQYIWPQYDPNATDARRRWHMNSLGDYVQVNYLPRLFVNPNYPWFFDANFSALNQAPTQVRTDFTMASSSRESNADYRRKAARFVHDAMEYVGSNVHPFIHISIGGPIVESVKAEEAASSEGYKVAIVFALASILSWWHCGSFVMGLYAGAQVIFTYLAAVGLYALIYKSLPLMTFSAVIWVMTFGLHGTLSFYDMFVYSGVMATKGRQNNLSVPQRVCFTIRRITLGVWLANVLAIVIFAINTTSAFDSVRQFSIFMMIAFLWNMYFIALPTPSVLCIQHFYFSNRRRDRQKQVDVLNVKAAECRRDPTMVDVLTAVQANNSTGETPYSLDADVLAARIGANRGINKKHYNGPGDYLAQQWRQGWYKASQLGAEMRDARHKLRKVRGRCCCGDDEDSGPEATRNDPTNGIEPRELQTSPVQSSQFNHSNNINRNHHHHHAGRLYFNRRMVRPDAVVHVPATVAERSETCWGAMCSAIKQRNPEGVTPPHVYTLLTTGEMEKDLRYFRDRWCETGRVLAVTTTDIKEPAGAMALAVRAAVRSQDPSYVVGGRDSGEFAEPTAPFGDAMAGETPITPSDPPAGRHGQHPMPKATETAASVEPGNAGFGLTKIRYRWRLRKDQPRTCCCGLCGRITEETAEQRMQRLMSRQIKAEGYTLFERFLIRAYVPFVHLARWVLLALLIALFILVIIFGSRIKAAGIPVTLAANDDGSSAAFAAMDDTFGQRGSCTFCGPYYRPINEYRVATNAEVAACDNVTIGPQMNVYVDSCGVCNGANDCLDCAGTPNGMYVKQCNSCEAPGTASCSCENSRACTYCQWALSIANSGGSGCSVACDASTCKNGGSCDQYTGKCNCVGGFAGDTCEACAAWLLPITANPRCYLECTITYDSPSCRCLSSSNQCSACPSGTRGYLCDQPALDCGAHGTFSTTSLKCVCSAGWGGELCEASEQCNLRGPLLSAAESPTGAELCACKGHWRGPTCQLCDCLNGGMCDDSTGKCACRGAFTGARCQTCDATCVAHGTCPTSLPARSLNIRACIEERCDAAAKAAETTCTDCMPPVVTTSVCSGLRTAARCSALGSCWWVADSSGPSQGACFSAIATSAANSTFACQCDNPEVLAGDICEECLAPAGGTCLADGTIMDCTGLIVNSATEAVAVDRCGVCGGDGSCRGCDGVPNSGLVYDTCGICGGNGACIGYQETIPLYVDYLLSFDGSGAVPSEAFAAAVVRFCSLVRETKSLTTQACVLELYLNATGLSAVVDPQAFYNWTAATGHMAEAVFTINYTGAATRWTHMRYRVMAKGINAGASANSLFYWADEMKAIVQANSGPSFEKLGVSFLLTSAYFPPATAVVLSKQSLWFAVGIGLAVTFVFLLVFFVSVTAALGGTLVAGCVCFGTLTVCTMFPAWELDAVLQVCVSCTIPIGVEYVVHMSSGYFDYLQTTTSHLFARLATRKRALMGAMLRSVSSICTCVVAVVLSSIAFDVSELVPSQRSGQVCITMHLVLAVAVFFFTGAMAAVGPCRSYQHWTISLTLCLVCGILACISVGIIYGLGGVMAPSGVNVPPQKNKS